MTASVQQNLAKAAKASDRLAVLLCMAGNEEPAQELSGRLVRMSEAAQAAAEQATRTFFINWAIPVVEDVNEPEAEEAQNL